MAEKKAKKKSKVKEEKPTEKPAKKPAKEEEKPEEVELKLSLPSTNFMVAAILFFAVGFFVSDAIDVNFIGGTPTGNVVNPGVTTTTNPSAVTTTLSSNPLSLIVINDKNCPICDTSAAIETTKKLFPDVKISNVDLNTTTGQQLVQKYGIKLLPAYLFGDTLPEQERYEEVAAFFDKIENKYLLKPGAVGATWVINSEAMIECLANKNLSSDTIIFLHSNRCGYCARMKPIIEKLQNESYKFHWAESTTGEGMEPVNDCLKDVVSGSVPEFICAGSIEKVLGAVPEENLRAFADSCKG